MRGRLIVFEGLDGAGKTTQIDLLNASLRLRGIPVVITSWNSSRLISKAIKRAKKAQLLTPYLFSTLHAADFMYRLEHIIVPALQEGYIVIADRYVYTALARDLVRNVDRRWIETMYALAPSPDLAFYCKAPVDRTLERVLDRNGGEHPSYYESGMDVISGGSAIDTFREFQTRVAAEYESIASQFGLNIIDTSGSIEEIQNSVRAVVDDRLKEWVDEESGGLPDWFATPGERVGRAAQEEAALPVLVPHSLPGRLVVVEGVDRRSTSRHANLLYNELIAEGYDARLALLGGSWVGIEITARAMRKTPVSLPTQALLAASELALYYEQTILPALKEGAIVVTDGYLFSLFVTFAAHGLESEWLNRMLQIFSVRPDCTIYLDETLPDLVSRTTVSPSHLWSPLPPGGVHREPAHLRKMLELYRTIGRIDGWHMLSSRSSEAELRREILVDVQQTGLTGVPRPRAAELHREVFSLFDRYDREYAHPRKVADLAVSLFDQTRSLHGYGDRERMLLWSAALLHDIGHVLSETQHEEYTYEAILRSPLAAATDAEREVIANIACLHRQPYAKLKFDHLARLSATRQLLVKRLAALLRIADALDESGRSVVQEIRCYEELGVIYLDLHAVSKALPERAAALRKADLFERIYQKPVVVARNWREKRARHEMRERSVPSAHRGESSPGSG